MDTTPLPSQRHRGSALWFAPHLHVNEEDVARLLEALERAVA